MQIYVGNLNYSTTVEGLIQLFSGCGNVTSAKIITDRETGKSKGFGFVEMEEKSEALAAIAQFNEYEFNGRKIRVNEAIQKAENGGGQRHQSRR